MVRNVAPLMQDLDQQDFYLLSGIEHGMRFSEWVDESKLSKYSDLDSKEVDYRLNRSLDLELIERRTMQYVGYRLRFEGYDALALRTFSERGTVKDVGAPLGEGKESDVLEGRNDGILALKFHREGLTNFREVHRVREYTADRSHVSWVYTARKAAEREFEVLEALHPQVYVPAPIDANRHAIVMEHIDGVELTRARLDPDRIWPVCRAILSEIAATYRRGFIHTDLSEFNVFVTDDRVVIFDWPQAVGTDHPNADELLERDVTNLLSFFHRKHPSLVEELPDIGEIVTDIRADNLESSTYIRNK